MEVRKKCYPLATERFLLETVTAKMGFQEHGVKQGFCSEGVKLLAVLTDCWLHLVVLNALNLL